MSDTEEKEAGPVFKADQYADYAIKAIETRHLAEKDDFFGVARYREELIAEFKKAIKSAYYAGIRKGRVDVEQEIAGDIE